MSFFEPSSIFFVITSYSIHYTKLYELKKEIIYTGDVLNTASRIEGLCNKHDVDLLLSKSLIDKLPLNHTFLPKRIGEISLRGKSTEIMLFTVERTGDKVY